MLSISGEDGITIDRKHIGAWTGQLLTRFLILSNELPRIADASAALASRFILLTQRESFIGREDKQLTDRLVAELPGILNWSLEGWDRLARRGHFIVPQSSAAAQQELEDLTSPIGAFIREVCILKPDQQADAKDVYLRWVSWCSEGGRVPGTDATFGRDLRAAVPGLRAEHPRKGHHGKQVKVYRGLGLRRID